MHCSQQTYRAGAKSATAAHRDTTHLWFAEHRQRQLRHGIGQAQQSCHKLPPIAAEAGRRLCQAAPWHMRHSIAAQKSGSTGCAAGFSKAVAGPHPTHQDALHNHSFTWVHKTLATKAPRCVLCAGAHRSASSTPSARPLLRYEARDADQHGLECNHACLCSSADGATAGLLQQ